MNALPFWKAKPLSEYSEEEWEALCDGCGRCCLHKLQDEDTDEIVYTRLACHLLDTQSIRCTKYADRRQHVSTCLQVTPELLQENSEWLPLSCAYRRVYEGKELPNWHPLISGHQKSVIKANMSVAGKVEVANDPGDVELLANVIFWVC